MDLNTILELKGTGVDIDGALRCSSSNSALYEKFLKKSLIDSTFSQITKAFEGGNREGALTATHTFKGVTANLGMDKLLNISSFMVDHIRADRFDEVAGAYPELEEVYKEICRVLANGQRQLAPYGCGEEVTICVSGILYWLQTIWKQTA